MADEMFVYDPYQMIRVLEIFDELPEAAARELWATWRRLYEELPLATATGGVTGD